MSERSHNKNNCITPIGEVVYKLTPDVLNRLVSKKASSIKAYPIYVCFNNSCLRNRGKDFMLTSANGLGAVIPSEMIKELDLGFVPVIPLFLFLILLSFLFLRGNKLVTFNARESSTNLSLRSRGYKKLKKLWLDSNKIRMVSLDGLPQLEELYLQHNQV